MLGSLNRGGQETFVMNVYRNIDREKIQFDFLVGDNCNQNYDFEDEIIKLGGKIYRIPLKSKNPIKSFFSTIKVIKRGNYQIVHRHSNTSLMSIDLVAAKLGGAKIRIAHSHSSYLEGRFKMLMHKLFIPIVNAISTNNLACSEDAGKWLFGEQRFEVVKNAIDISKFSYNEMTRNVTRKTLSIDDKFVVGHVGRFTYAKNHDFLIDIVKEIKKMDSSIILILVGDGSLRKKIELKIKEFGLQDNVKLLGVQNDIASLLQSFDIFLFPSHYEGLPVTLIEAQAAGLPCLISDAITSEVCLTRLVHKISLNKSPKEWVKEIMKYKDISNRESKYDELLNSGYDIKHTSKFLEDIYSKDI